MDQADKDALAELRRADEEIARLKAELAACETEVRTLRKSQDEARDEIVRLDGIAGKWERFGSCENCQAKADQSRAERARLVEAFDAHDQDEKEK